MKVILLKDVKGIGKRFEEKEVSGGHANNFLIPHKLAVRSDSPAAKEVKTQIEKEKMSREKEGEKIQEDISKISGTSITLKEKANDKGHLFSKLTAEKISSELKSKKGLDIKASHFLLDNPIKEIGEFEIEVEIESKKTHFKLIVEKA